MDGIRRDESQVRSQQVNNREKTKSSGVRPLWCRNLIRLVHNRAAAISIATLVFMLLFSFLGPFFSPYGQNQLDVLNAEQGPTLAHLLGTDDYGRDILTRLMYAGRISLTIGLASTVLSVVLGATIGIVSGYFGGWVDAVIMRLADLLMSIPSVADHHGRIAFRIQGPRGFPHLCGDDHAVDYRMARYVAHDSRRSAFIEGTLVHESH